MTKRSFYRLISILSILISCSVGVYIILSHLRENIVFFYTPSEIEKILTDQQIRIGGLVKENSVQKLSANKVNFTITDHKHDIVITYSGILPALFREGQGVVAEGKLGKDNIFIARKLLTKHDENYRPPRTNSAPNVD